jgi:hypothetical protein
MERKNQTFGTSMNQEMEQAKHQAKKEPNTWKQQGKQARTKSWNKQEPNNGTQEPNTWNKQEPGNGTSNEPQKEPNTWKQQGKQARTKLKDKDSHTSRFTSLPSHPFESDFETKGRLLPTKKQNHFIENKN